MYGSFLPAIRRIRFHNDDVEKDVAKLPKPAKGRFKELLTDLQNGQVPKSGKNTSQVSGVKKYRLDSQYRVAFSLQEETAVILCVGDHKKMDRFLDRVESETRRYRIRQR